VPRYRVTVTRLPNEPLSVPPERDPIVWPPIDFPVFGLDSAWSGPRWLSELAGAVGQSPGVIGLAHGDRPGPMRGHPFVLVASFRPSGDGWSSSDGFAERVLAEDGLHRLMNATIPYLDDEDDRRRIRRNHIPYLLTRAYRYRSWARANWRIGARTATARFARFAGGWAGFVFERGTLAVVAVGFGVSPHAIHLVRVKSGLAYHFDIGRPIDHDHALAYSREKALGNQREADTRPRRPHGDVRQLVAAENLSLPPGVSVA
jgi:hypothetical protein